MRPLRAARGLTASRVGTCVIMILLSIRSGSAVAELSNDTFLGPGVRSRPAYDGSASQRWQAVPVVRYLGEPWFSRSTQGLLEAGARIELAPGLHAGFQLAYEAGRESGESDLLARHAVPNVTRNASAGLQVEWDHYWGPMPLTLLGRWRQHVDATLGMQADLRLSAGLLRQRWFSAGAFLQATSASAKSSNAMYGVTEAQSLKSGLDAFRASGGWLSTSAGLLASAELHPHWVVVGSVELRRLASSVSHSPLVERRSNRYLSAGLAYRY